MKNWLEDPYQNHDPDDPDPWHALYLDKSIPVSSKVKRAWLKDTSSKSRQFLLPFVRPIARLQIILIQILKATILRKLRATKTLHRLLVFGLSRFVTPEANWLILRHFHIGAEIQQFIAANIPGIEIPPLHFMQFKNLEALKDNAFLNHDINLYNFVIWLNMALDRNNQTIEAPEKLDFSMITDGDFPIDEIPSGRLNKIDLMTAIESYTPVYQLFLSDSDFWRAANSLQLDETIAIYVSKILNDPFPIMLVNNRHPMVVLSTLQAGFRLVLHGWSTESLHAYLVSRKRQQQSAENSTHLKK